MRSPCAVCLVSVLLVLGRTGPAAAQTTVSSVPQHPTAGDLLRTAQAAYDTGDFAAAVDAYAGVTWQGGVRDADVWYNAGTAHARANQRGAAIGAYRIALRLDPGHRDAAANLALLRQQVQEHPSGSQGFVAWLLGPACRIPLAWWRTMTVALWVLAWAGAALALWRPRPWRRTAVLAAIGGVVAAAGLGAVLLARSLEPRAIVVAEEAPLRTGPGPDYLETYALPDGAECTLLSRHAGWVQVELPDGGTGWTERERVLHLPLGDPQPGHAPTRWEEKT